MIAWAPFWIAFVVSALVAGPTLRFLRASQSRQTISEFAPEAHQKKQGTPTMGGLIVIAGLLTAFLAGALAHWKNLSPFGRLPNIEIREAATGPALVVLLGFGLIGFVDDFVVPRLWKGKRGLGWKQKLLLQIVFAGAAVGLSTELAGSPVGWIGGIVAILYCANAYNFADGLDGLAGGLGIVLAWCLSTFAAGPDGVAVWGQCIALIGAMLPFLLLNVPPARVFMGDVGALPLGGLFGLWVAQIVASRAAGGAMLPSSGLGATVVGLGVATFILHAELIPVPLQVFWVKVFKRRLFPYTPIHHAFEKAGWPETRVVGTFLIVQLLVAVLGLTIAQSWRPGWL